MIKMRLENLTVGNACPLFLIAGPCMMESEELVLDMAKELSAMAQRLKCGFIFKTSFDKANRTSEQAQRGVSLDEGLRIFRRIKQEVGCLLITDVHQPHQCQSLAQVVDVLQIPALLCRQTDLIQAAAETGKPLNIKKGQFLSAAEMLQVAKKAQSFGAQVMLCERGNSFGYHLLVNDMRGLCTMSQSGCPVIFDATHSVQKPGALGDKSGGERQFVEALARAAVAVGVAGIFMETHPEPDRALSDGPNMVPLQELEALMTTLIALDKETKKHPYCSFSEGSFPHVD